MFKVKDNKALLRIKSQREFLNLLEENLRAAQINRYLYIFLPAGSQFNPKLIEINQFGYEKTPEHLERTLTFIRSPFGSRFTKLTTSGMMMPFYENSEAFKADLMKESDIDINDTNDDERSLYIPVHAGDDRTGLFLLRAKKETATLFDNPRSAQVMCQMLHQRYCELWELSNHDVLTFTEREKDILHWMAKGKSNAEIGSQIDISKHTVNSNMRVIFYKLSVSNRISAAVKASELGLLRP